MRRAELSDTDTVVDLWNEAANWLADRTDQWQYPVRIDGIKNAIRTGSVWLLSGDQAEIATVTLDEQADPHLWFESDNPADALYVHRLIVARNHGGHGLGSKILDWASDQSFTQHRSWLRLDAWTTNVQLHDYYLQQGFHLVRVVHDAGPSGAVFQRRSATVIG